MRLLLLTPFVPDAGAAHGGAIYVGTLASALAARAQLGLVALADAGSQPARTPASGFSFVAAVPRAPSGPGAGLAARAKMLWRWRRAPLVAAKHWHPEVPRALARALAEW